MLKDDNILLSNYRLFILYHLSPESVVYIAKISLFNMVACL